MISRRKLLKILSGLPLSGLMISELAGSSITGETLPKTAETSLNPVQKRSGKSIYSSIGVRPLINARGTVTIVGATRILPEVQHAMDEAVRDYVQLDELMDGVGCRLAELTGAEWGAVTSGASAAVTLATVGCVTGGDPDKLWRVPDLTGMKDEVIMPSHSRNTYDVAARAVGVKIIEVANREELEAAMGPKTAMIMLLGRSRQWESGPLSLKEISFLAKPRNIPVLVDAADQRLPVPNPYLEQGADLVAYSGGKVLRGPQCAGLLIGRKDLVQAAWITSAPHHGFGRGFKVGREEIMGMLAAVEMWMKRDHEKERETWASWMNHIVRRLDSVPDVTTEGGTPDRPSLSVQWDMDRIPLTGHDVEQLLWDDNPRVAVSGAGSFLPFPPNMNPNISINPSQLEAGEEKIIADRVFAVLSNPPHISKPSGQAAFDVSGQWDLEMKFSASKVNQKLFFEQNGTELVGTHLASYAPRDLEGTIHGKDIFIRSSHTDNGVRLNFEFTGTVNEDFMEGKVSMGEYGMADWKAIRRNYQPTSA